MKKIVVFTMILVFAVILSVFPTDELYPTYVLPWYADRLANTSRLTDAEIWEYLRHGPLEDLRQELDRDRDGIADGTGIAVDEFIARMEIIIDRNRKIEKQRIMIMAGFQNFPEDDI